MSRLLMVSPFAPYRDGIAIYAQQELRRLVDEGHQVEVCSPLPSAAEHHHGTGGSKGMVGLLRTARNFEGVIVQFYPELLFGGCRTASQRVVQWGLLASLGHSTDLEIRIHEIDYAALEINAFERKAARAAMRSAQTISMHTEQERSQLSAALSLDPAKISLVGHGDSFVRRYGGSKAEARRELGLDPDRHVFLSIGFLQAHKGFDRAVDAFAKLPTGASTLHIVGSARVDHPDVVAHVGRLRRLTGALPNAHLHDAFVGDVEFDRWLAAADTLVLPYREIWSSGVVERAKLYDLVVIASAVGGLGGQVSGSAVLVNDDAALLEAMAARIEGAVDEPSAGKTMATPSGWNVDARSPDQSSIQRQVRERAEPPSLAATADEPIWLPLGELGEPLQRTPATSARPGVAPVKRVMQALTWWQIQPLLERIDRLEQASLAVAKRTDAALAPPRVSDGGSP